jgi:hypothetical protein
MRHMTARKDGHQTRNKTMAAKPKEKPMPFGKGGKGKGGKSC